jgi:hypothetical protein
MDQMIGTAFAVIWMVFALGVMLSGAGLNIRRKR